MKTLERSAALARALTSETDGLPKDFAVQVAALAEAEHATWRLSWNDIGLLGAFAAMIGICVAGRAKFGAQPWDGAEWLGPIGGAVLSHPWLVIGIVGIAVVQGLTFRRRAMT